MSYNVQYVNVPYVIHLYTILLYDICVVMQVKVLIFDPLISDLSSCLTVEVCVMTSSHSLKVAQCRTLTQRLQQPISGSRGTVGVAGSGHRAAECDSRESGGGRGSGGDGDDDVTGKEGEEVSVLFSTRCARFLDLQPGQYVRIHPPWLENVHVYICTCMYMYMYVTFRAT